MMALVGVELLGLAVYLGNLLGYVCAVGVSYLGHSVLTFRKPVSPATLRRFVTASLSTLMLSQVLLYVIDEIFLVEHRISLAIVVVYIVIQGYLLNKFWVYKH